MIDEDKIPAVVYLCMPFWPHDPKMYWDLKSYYADDIKYIRADKQTAIIADLLAACKAEREYEQLLALEFEDCGLNVTGRWEGEKKYNLDRVGMKAQRLRDAAIAKAEGENA